MTRGTKAFMLRSGLSPKLIANGIKHGLPLHRFVTLLRDNTDGVTTIRGYATLDGAGQPVCFIDNYLFVMSPSGHLSHYKKVPRGWELLRD